jgi:hypothetical protein
MGVRLPALRISVLCALGVALAIGLRAQRQGSMSSPPLAPAAWVVDMNDGATSGPLPARPLEGQKRPPCSGWQVSINGGCWLKLATPEGANKSQCPAGYFSYGAACYVPVLKAPAIPTAVTK